MNQLAVDIQEQDLKAPPLWVLKNVNNIRHYGYYSSVFLANLHSKRGVEFK